MAEKKIQVFNKERLDKCCLAFFPSIYIQPAWTNESAGTSFISFLPPVLLPSHTQKRMENPLQEGTRFPESITDSSLLLLTLSHRCTLNWLTVSPTASRESLLWNVLWSGTFHCLTNLSDPYSWSCMVAGHQLCLGLEMGQGSENRMPDGFPPFISSTP